MGLKESNFIVVGINKNYYRCLFCNQFLYQAAAVGYLCIIILRLFAGL